MARRLQTSLTVKLLWVITALSLVLVMFTSALEIAQDRNDLIAREKREAEAAVMANSAALSLALWTLDTRAIEIAANSLVTGTSIFRVEVLEDRAILLRADRKGASLNADYTWETPLYRPNTNQVIGRLRVSESYQNVLDLLRGRIGFLVAAEMLKVLILAALLFFIIHRWITRPLSALAARVSDTGDDPISISRPAIGGHDEIDALVEAVNTTRRERLRMDAEQKLLQRREAQSAKMQALGQMAGGVAHDFNNILGAILGFGRLLADDVPRQSLQQHFAQRILAACDRGRTLVEQVLTFARGGGLEQKRLDLRDIVHQCETVLAASFAKTTRARFNYADKELPVMGSEGRLGQLIANLCLNANDALGGAPGDLTVDMGRITRDSMTYIKANGPLERLNGTIDPACDYIYLRIADTGEGIGADVLDRIFEPFFTTKGGQRGTGFGLPVVLGVVEAHGGAVHVHSQPGEGTTFSIYLPMTDAPASAPQPSVPGAASGGKERVLVVDDEVDIADALTMGLERLGYNAVGANDPLEALEAFTQDPLAFDAVITDQVMPGMRGIELVARLKALRPDIKIILCTGYSDNINERVALAGGADAFHIKPIDAAALSTSLNRLFTLAK